MSEKKEPSPELKAALAAESAAARANLAAGAALQEAYGRLVGSVKDGRPSPEAQREVEDYDARATAAMAEHRRALAISSALVKQHLAGAAQ